MSQFYGTMENRGGYAPQSTRCGHRGFETHTRGWDIGIRVECDEETINGVQCDVLHVYGTGGSNGGEITNGSHYVGAMIGRTDPSHRSTVLDYRSVGMFVGGLCWDAVRKSASEFIDAGKL